MKYIIVLSILCMVCFAGCGDNHNRGAVKYGTVIPEENREAAAAFIEKACVAANPSTILAGFPL